MSIASVNLYSLALLIIILVVHGSPFEGGTISYKVIGKNGSGLIVRITQSYTYAYPTIYCNNTYIANQWALSLTGYPDANATLDCIANCSTDGGYLPVTMILKCTDYSAPMFITVGQRTDDVILANGSYFTIAYASNGWRNLSLPLGVLANNWSLSTVIDLRVRSDGTWNTPPKATMISPVYVPVGVQQTISIPTIDADNDNVRCRFASGSNECGTVCSPASLPAGTSISTDCNLTITGANADDWYYVALEVEDFENSTSTTPYSSVPVQFLVYVYAQPACTQRPYLYGNAPSGSCVGVEVGVPFTLLLVVENYCAGCGFTIQDIATQSFPIVNKSTIVKNSTILWSVTLTWTPTADEIGSQIFCSVGVDSQNVQSNQFCLTFTVGNGTLGTCPGSILTTQELTTEQLTTVITSFNTTNTQLASITTEVINTTTPLASITTEVVNTTTQLASITTEVVNTTTQLASITTEVINTTTPLASITTEVINTTTPLASITTEVINTTTPLASTTTLLVSTTIILVNTTAILVNTTTQVDNITVTSANISSFNLIAIILPITIIPICCCCWWFYFVWSCRTIDIDQKQEKLVTMYTIQGAAVYRDLLAIGVGHPVVENEDKSRPKTCPSTARIDGGDGHMNPLFDRAPMTLRRNSFPVSPSIQVNSPTATAATGGNIREDDIRRRTDPLNYLSTSQSSILVSEDHSLNTSRTGIVSNTQPPIKLRKLHPRWVLRLSHLRSMPTAPMSDNLTSGMERLRNGLSRPRRFLAKKPRYAYQNE